MSVADFDIVVIGGGPGGYVAAIRAAQLGARVALVERETLGGVCLNWGCIPTKALLHAAEVWRGLQQTRALGIEVVGASFDFARVMARSRDVPGRLARGVKGLMAKNGVKVFAGHGRIAGVGRVEVAAADGELLQLAARDIVVATGARPRELPGVQTDGQRLWSSRDALSAQQLPGSLLIVGAGAIGMEFASFYAAFGTEVTVLEARDRVLPLEDHEVSAQVARAYEAQGVRVRTGVKLQALRADGDGVTAVVHGPGGDFSLGAQAALVAIGVTGNVERLGLEGTGVRVEAGRIVADAFGATDEAHVHAIGDVTGGPWLAHRAMHHGLACVERVLGAAPGGGAARALRSEDIPGCTYGHPQTASIGLTEEAARSRGLKVRVGRFPLAGNGKAVALGEADGFAKTLVDADTGEILGAHLVGPGVTELIGAFSVARALEGTDEALLEAVWPHPTLSESLHESLLAALSRPLHM